MTTVRILYNPLDRSNRIFFEADEIFAVENKVYTFLQSNDFYEALYPFRRRYVIWHGLLPELIHEVNDSELHIIFEGRERDFIQLEHAFERSKPMVEQMGYENEWQLSFVRNYDAEHMTGQLIEAAKSIRDMCETRAELHEVDGFISKAERSDIKENYINFCRIMEKHFKKWSSSSDRYKKEKMDYLKIIADHVKGMSKLLEQQEV